MIALYKLWKMFFILSKKPFPSRDIQAFVFLSSPLFLPVGHFFSGWSQAYYIFWRNTLLRGIKAIHKMFLSCVSGMFSLIKYIRYKNIQIECREPFYKKVACTWRYFYFAIWLVALFNFGMWFYELFLKSWHHNRWEELWVCIRGSKKKSPWKKPRRP